MTKTDTLRVRFEEWFDRKYLRPYRRDKIAYTGEYHVAASAWQAATEAAQLSEAEIEELAREIADEILRRHNGFGRPPDVNDIASLLRGKLGGKK